MFDFYLLYQPKVKENKIIALEALLRPKDDNISVLDYIKSVSNSIQLDMDVIQHCLDDIEQFNVQIPVSVNIHPFSILNSDFIDYAIEKIKNKNITIELAGYQQLDIDSHFIRNVKRLKHQGIAISIDDYGRDFTRTDIAIAIEADEVKFDIALLKNIEKSYMKFKHLVFLYLKIKKLCTSNIVFEGVETQTQKNLIELIADKPIIQGFIYFKPMRLEDIFAIDIFDNSPIAKESVPNKIKGINLDYLVHNAAKNKQLDLGDKDALNAFLKDNDILGLVHNEDPKKTLDNFRDIYFHESSVLRNGVMSMIDSSDKLVIIRNNSGVVIYDNKAHQTLLGTSLVGINPQDIVATEPNYQGCIEQDSRLILDERTQYHIDEEAFDGELYSTLREKVFFNNKSFIISNVSPSESGLRTRTKDSLTDCYTREFLNQNLSHYNNKIITFIDLNGFKAINDNFGHEAGDYCLVEFSTILRSMLRDEDIVIRFGGDEFVILFDSSSVEHIDKRLIQLNDTVKRHFNELGYKLSFSYGLANIEDNNINAAIRQADTKMYAHKKLTKRLRVSG